MANVTAFEAKTRFGKLLERVARGKEIVITRHEKPVARIIPAGRSTVDEIRIAVSGLRELRGRIAAGLGEKPGMTDTPVKSLIQDGRR